MGGPTTERNRPGPRLGNPSAARTASGCPPARVDYFWTAINPGSSRQHTADGTTREVTYLPGQTRHFHFAQGEYLLHDLENVGDTELVFSTVEFLDSANPHCRLTESEAPQGGTTAPGLG